MGSGGAPGFITHCAPEHRAFFCDPESANWEDIKGWMDTYTAKVGEPEWYASNGYPGPVSRQNETTNHMKLNPYLHEYGSSKALLAMVTRHWARARPDLISAVCSPGCIDTDCEPHTFGFYDSSAQYPMTLPVEMGVVAPMHLLFGPVTSGWYYGNDAKRSPLHVGRDQGTAEYEGGQPWDVALGPVAADTTGGQPLPRMDYSSGKPQIVC
jgi:hypothetical protein